MKKDELFREIEKTVRRHNRIEKEEAAAYEIELSLRSGDNPGYIFETRPKLVVGG